MTSSAEERLVEAILAAITDQRLRPGAKLGEQALCELFGCNRAQVRRALSALTGYHAVTHIPNRGTFVATPSAEEAREVFEARRAIEATIARSAAVKATPEQIAQLKAHLEEERTHHSGGARREEIRLSRAFHLELAEVAGNRVLAGYLSDLTLRTSLILGLYGSDAAGFCGVDDHAEILDAVAAGDPERAADLARDHLRHIEAGLDITPRPAAANELAAAFPDRVQPA